jgi:hypothetical protein
MQVPLKDEDSGSGSGWSSGSMLDDLRNRLARLEKSTSGKTPAASRVWASTAPTTNVPPPASAGAEKRLSLSDLSVRPVSNSNSQGKDMEVVKADALDLKFGLSTDNPASSMLSNRSTTPDNSPPPPRRVLPPPPVFAVPEPAVAKPVAPSASASASASAADAVRANAKAEAARLFAGTKFVAPPPARSDTQSTIGTGTDVDSIFDMRSQSQTQSTVLTTQSQSVFGPSLSQETDEADLDEDIDLYLDEDVDVEGDGDTDEEGGEDDAKVRFKRVLLKKCILT